MASKRDSVVRVAIELFARDGWNGVTLRMIADETSTSLGSLYYLFPEKKQLYNAAVLQASLECNRLVIDALTEDGPPVARLRRLCRLLIDRISSDDANFRLIGRASDEDKTKDFPSVIEGPFREMHVEIGKTIRELIPRRIKRIQLEWVISHVISIMYGAAKLDRQHIELLCMNDAEVHDQYIDHLIEFTISAIMAPRLQKLASNHSAE